MYFSDSHVWKNALTPFIQWRSLAVISLDLALYLATLTLTFILGVYAGYSKTC